MSRPRLNLHLELIRHLHQKDRPKMLPNTLIRIALTHLIACEQTPNDKNYLKRIKAAVGGTQT